ncbi:hypothetical protein LAN87_003033 [Salmonella enterica]|nr:hypothetical protein [Salmonella enterica]HCM1832463.1 hypothetical protein [Salmonella enterica subsp. salamae serovar 48:z81:z39]EHL3470335.1 hypothetical protein [Salmonella enterica]EHX3572946.1 hypothetical protein [Salmonella enterica]EIB6274983.1 hypothetical protein [Salmonella enterica]
MKKLTMRTCESTSPASLLVIKILILTLHEQTKIRLNEHSEKTEQEIASSMHDSLMTEAVLQQMKDIRYTLNKVP